MKTLSELVAEAKRGKQKAWKEIYEMMFEKIYRFVRGRLKDYDKAVAEDITASSFLKFFENLESIDETKNPSSYLFTIALNEVRKFFITSSRFVPQFDSVRWDRTLNVEDEVLEREKRRVADRFYATCLTDEERDILSLKFSGITYREIGEILGVSERTIKRKVRKILDKAEKFFRKEKMLV